MYACFHCCGIVAVCKHLLMCLSIIALLSSSRNLSSSFCMSSGPAAFPVFVQEIASSKSPKLKSFTVRVSSGG